MAVALGKEIVAFLIVAVPVVLPIFTAVAFPPKLTVVGVVLKILPVAAEVVTSPPLTATSPAVVMSPVDPAIEKLVAVTSLAPSDRALTIPASDRSIPLVIGPPPEVVTLRPAAKVLVLALLSI